MRVSRTKARERRHLRIRRKLHGTAERPRLSVYRSNTGLYVQLTDDVTGVSLAGFKTTVFPATTGPKVMPVRMARGKFHGGIAAPAPSGR